MLFRSWRFSGTLLPAMFLAFLVGFFASDWTPGAMFAMNLKIVLNVFFFVQGLSLIWWWFVRRRVGVFWRCLALAVFAFPVFWLWLVFLGVIGSVTGGYNFEEATFGRTRKLLEEFKDSDAEILICTKSDLVLRDLDLLKQMKKVTVSWSINTLDETFRADMDKAVSIERRIAAMRKVYEAGIRTVCFVSPIFPGITNFKAIFHEVKDICDLFWLENLNLRGSFKANIMDYIKSHYPHLFPLYEEIYSL